LDSHQNDYDVVYSEYSTALYYLLRSRSREISGLIVGGDDGGRNDSR
jgi:hypothetical protein